MITAKSITSNNKEEIMEWISKYVNIDNVDLGKIDSPHVTGGSLTVNGFLSKVWLQWHFKKSRNTLNSSKWTATQDIDYKLIKEALYDS